MLKHHNRDYLSKLDDEQYLIVSEDALHASTIEPAATY